MNLLLIRKETKLSSAVAYTGCRLEAFPPPHSLTVYERETGPERGTRTTVDLKTPGIQTAIITPSAVPSTTNGLRCTAALPVVDG